jgi:beta-phosphoglucomutase-like phosphatase (HAD superfamily)
MKKTLRPQILIFDVDGVLVDVRGTYWRSALETVRSPSGHSRQVHREIVDCGRRSPNAARFAATLTHQSE